ncbi:NAD(P)H-hydrate dehydratase [Streptomyces sp. NBC_01538]|uniref:ADP-dependent NAD(P)H-hydrate dehydratase n=1 Tax=Streptomyces sp. NBC_01538 TaxID=2903897 RepID=UPI00386826BA
MTVDRAWARRTAATHLNGAAQGVKGDGGMVIVVGGSQAYGAPPYLAGLGALRAGAHRVYVLAPHGPAAAAAGLEMHLLPHPGTELQPSAVKDLVPLSAHLSDQLARTGAAGQLVWLIGPGLGGHPAARSVLEALAEARAAESRPAVVIDGSLGGGESGIDRIATLKAQILLLNRVEAAALTGEGTLSERGPGARIEDLTALAARAAVSAVTAKGEVDVVVAPETVHRVPAGHPSLAKSSSGDVLAGVAAGLLAQRVPPAQAAALACYLVGTTGRRLAARTGPGWLPSELLDALPHPVRAVHGSVLRRLARQQITRSRQGGLHRW